MAQFYGTQSKRPLGMRVGDMEPVVGGYTGWKDPVHVGGRWEPKLPKQEPVKGWETLPDGKVLITAGKHLTNQDERGVYIEENGKRYYGAWDASLGGYVFDPTAPQSTGMTTADRWNR